MMAEVKLVAKVDIFWRTRSMEETSSSWNHQTIKSGCKINNGAYSNRKFHQKQKVGKFPFRKSVEDIKLFLGGGLEIFRNVDRGVDVRIDACSHCGLGVWILWSTNNYNVVRKLPDSDAEKKISKFSNEHFFGCWMFWLEIFMEKIQPFVMEKIEFEGKKEIHLIAFHEHFRLPIL